MKSTTTSKVTDPFEEFRKLSDAQRTLTLAGKTYRYEYEELEMQQALLALRVYDHRYDQLQLRGSVDMQADLDNDGTYAGLRAVAYLVKEVAEDGSLLAFSKHTAEAVVLEELKQLKGPELWKTVEAIKKNFFLRQNRLRVLSSVDSPGELHAATSQFKTLYETFAKADSAVKQLMQNANALNAQSSEEQRHGTQDATTS